MKGTSEMADKSAEVAGRTPHTEGPWTVIETEPGKFAVFAPSCGEIVCRIEEWGIEEDRADATLMAAAPDMLEAIKALRANLIRVGWEENSIMVEGIDRAMAKAEGRS